MKQEMISAEYNHDGQIIINQLPIFKCQLCGRKHLLDTLYTSYTNNKDITDINFEFICLYD